MSQIWGASLGRLLQGSSRFFLTCQCLVCVYVQFARSVLATAVLTRDAAKVCCNTYLRLASVGCSKNVMLAERSVERPSCFFFHFLIFCSTMLSPDLLPVFGVRRISGRNNSLRRSVLSRRQLSSAIVVLDVLNLHFSSLYLGDYRNQEEEPKSRK